MAFDRTEHILVDGWNVIHAEPKLAKLLAVDAVSAQKALADVLRPIHDIHAARITIVYDGNGSDVSVVYPDNVVRTFAEVYTPSSMTADEFIERFCAVAKNKSRIVVISNDHMIWETVSTFGAVCMRIGEIFSLGKIAAADIGRLTRRVNAESVAKWRGSSPLADLDKLELDVLASRKSSLFDSKKMRKILAKMGASPADFGAKNAQKSPEKPVFKSKVSKKSPENGVFGGSKLQKNGVSDHAKMPKNGGGSAKKAKNAGANNAKMPKIDKQWAAKKLAPKPQKSPQSSPAQKRKLPKIFKDFKELK